MVSQQAEVAVPVETGMTLGEAKAFVKRVEALFAAGDVEAIVAGYTPDVVAHFGDFPEMRGPAEIERFLRARFARQRNYRLTKDLRSMSGNVISNYWEGTWEDAETGKRMRGRGAESWTMREGKIAMWEAAFNVWEDGGGPVTPIT
jgi:nuclear transport factor 2 (NTF2) superfamily protein